MPKPVCIPCQRFFRPKKTGFSFIEGMPVGPGHVEPGTSMPESWKPYKLWQGDVWDCKGCNAEIIVGCGSSPIAEHFQATFAAEVEQRGATYQVNDC